MSRPVAFRLPDDDYGVLCVFAEAAGDFDGRNFVTRQQRIDTLKNRLQQPTKRIT